MAKHNELGVQGEALAVEYLQGLGYAILERNWRFKRAEVDIIAREGGTLVFVEVKARSRRNFGEPEEAVNPKKERLLADAAQAYAEKIGHDWALRFDIVSVLFLPEGPLLRHYKDAFFPDWGAI
jgi:putative endonuclease